MRFSVRPARSAAAVSAAALLLAGSELALHEVQQARSDGCDPWQAGCPAVVEYTGQRPGTPARLDLAWAEIVTAAVDAPYRPCDTVGLVCQGRIIGDVLWDQYVMAVAGRSGSAATAASALHTVPALEAQPAEPSATAAPGPAQPAPVPGRIVRTHGSRAGEGVAPLPSAPAR